jgi:hypothetical protein
MSKIKLKHAEQHRVVFTVDAIRDFAVTVLVGLDTPRMQAAAVTLLLGQLHPIIAGAILRDAEERKVAGITVDHVTQFCIDQLVASHNSVGEFDPDVIADMHADIVAESSAAN